MPKTLINIKLAPDLLARVNVAATAAGLDRTAWITAAIADKLNPSLATVAISSNVPTPPKAKPRRLDNRATPRGPACYDAVSGEPIYR